MTVCIHTSPESPPYSLGHSGAAYGLRPMVPCQVKGLKPLSAFNFSSVSSSPVSAASIQPEGRLSCSHERNPTRNSCCSGVSSFVQRIASASSVARRAPLN